MMDTRREEIVPRRSGESEAGEEPLRRGHSSGRNGRRNPDWQKSGRKRYGSEAWRIDGNEEGSAEGLGWFSIGLGLAAIVAPGRVSRLIGLDNHRFLLRAVGIRELASGIGILTNRKPTAWLWSRVAGDVMDLALLRRAFGNERANKVLLTAATAAVAGVTVMDVRCSLEYTKDEAGAEEGGHVSKNIMINRSPEELYSFWHDFENLPRFMEHLESVRVINDKRSHWVVKGPAGKRVEWEAEIVEDRPGERICWRSLEGSEVQHAGCVMFQAAPSERGSLVKVELDHSPPTGVIGAAVAKLFGRAPEQEIDESLRRFKQLMEAGEIITTDGQPAGRARSTSWKWDRTVPRLDTVASAYL
jgi:uncharacterized membrane protein